TGLRFCLLLHAKQNDDISRVCDSRNLLCDSLQNLDFACKLWGNSSKALLITLVVTRFSFI
ncbi:hypothetical protein D5018_11570, partial [Parashewanella curva]